MNEQLDGVKVSQDKWSARELMAFFKCFDWYAFQYLVERVNRSCKNIYGEGCGHVTKTTRINPKSKLSRSQIDYELTAYACYLISINGEPSAETIAIAQRYFHKILSRDNCVI
jgi:DNA-damage-inducible protein D